MVCASVERVSGVTSKEVRVLFFLVALLHSSPASGARWPAAYVYLQVSTSLEGKPMGTIEMPNGLEMSLGKLCSRPREKDGHSHWDWPGGSFLGQHLIWALRWRQRIDFQVWGALFCFDFFYGLAWFSKVGKQLKN